MPELKQVTLETVAAGGAGELFQAELEKVLENMRDPNTSPSEKRVIRLDVEFTPHESQGRRDEASVFVKVTTKLAGIKPAGGYLFVVREDGELRAYTHDVRQETLPLEQVDMKTGEVLPMKGRAGA